MTCILIVEDNDLNRDMLSRRLTRRGFRVIVAVDGAAGVETTIREHPDLVLMDIRLAQGTDGIDAAIEIRQRLGIPSLFMSAFSDQATMVRAQAAQPVGFVGKPYDDARLGAALLTGETDGGWTW